MSVICKTHPDNPTMTGRRKETYNDLPAEKREVVAAGLQEAFGEDFERQGVSEDRVAFFLSQNFQAHNALLTAWDGDALVGTAGYVLMGTDVFLCNVWTNPERRRSGVAREMVAAAEIAAREYHHVRSVKLWCEKSLIEFYTKMGYAWKEQSRVSRDKFVEIMKKKF